MPREWLNLRRHRLLIVMLVVVAAVLTIARYEAGLVLLATWGIVWLLLMRAPGLRAQAAQLPRGLYLVAASALVAALAVVVWVLGRPPEGAMAREALSVYHAWIEPADEELTTFRVREYMCRLPREECVEPSLDDATLRVVKAQESGFAVRAVRLFDPPIDPALHLLTVHHATIDLENMPTGSLYRVSDGAERAEPRAQADTNRVRIRWTLESSPTDQTEHRTDHLWFTYVSPDWIPWRPLVEPVLGVSSLNNFLTVFIATLATLAVRHLPSLVIVPAITAGLAWLKSRVWPKPRRPRRAAASR